MRYSREHESEVAHFACHAVADPECGLGSYLGLADGLQIRLVDLEAEDYLLGGMPVAFLNACGTGCAILRKTSDLVREFMSRGGRGVVATECDVPDAFASVFIQRVYDQVLKGETFGRALLAARRYFWEEHHNPLGLLYAAYTRLETRIVPGRAGQAGIGGRRSSEDTIEVIVADAVVTRGERRIKPVGLKVGVLAENVNLFLTQIEGIMAKAPEEVAGKFKLTEFTISAEITAKGGLSLLGTGGEVGGKGGLTSSSRGRGSVDKARIEWVLPETVAAFFQALSHRFDKNGFQVHNTGVAGPAPQTRLAQYGPVYYSRDSARINQCK